MPSCHGGWAEGETEGKTLEGTSRPEEARRHSMPSLDMFEWQGSGGSEGWLSHLTAPYVTNRPATVGWGPVGRWNQCVSPYVPRIAVDASGVLV